MSYYRDEEKGMRKKRNRNIDHVHSVLIETVHSTLGLETMRTINKQ